MSQLELRRVALKDEHLAEQALHEIVRRLNGERPSEPTTEWEGIVWATTADFLDGQLQTNTSGATGAGLHMSDVAVAARSAAGGLA